MPCILSAEETKLVEAVDDFGFVMRMKLLRMHREGRRGWDTPLRKEDWERRLFELAEQLIRGEAQEIDIANYAMFIWYLRLQKEAEGKDGNR